VDDPQIEDAQSILSKIHQAHGQPSHWRAQMSATAYFSDTWPNWLFRVGNNPWKETSTNLKLDWQTSRDNSRILVLSGKQKGRVFGIQNWETYEIKDEKVRFRKNRSMYFFLPTFEYFFEFPFRINEATASKYGGKKTIDSIDYHCLFLSWNSLEPQKEIDQYIVYVHPKSFLIDYIDFTVRDKSQLIYATVHYEDHRKIDGFILPHRATAYFQSQAPGKSVLHEMVIDSFKVRSGLPSEYFIPNPEKSSSK
jgi:hypothetical protein